MPATESLTQTIHEQVQAAGFRMSQSQMDVQQLIEKRDAGRIHFRPAGQRRYVWNQAAASQLIESILLDIQMPPIQIGRLIERQRTVIDNVIDGQQRCTSLYNFVKGINVWQPDRSFTLTGLRKLACLQGKSFEDLLVLEDGELANKILSYPIHLMVGQTNDPAKIVDLFLRLNRNTYTLNSMEIRNAVFHSGLLDVLEEVASDPDFRRLTRLGADNRLQGVELLLRVLAFHRCGPAVLAKEYRSKLSRFLDAELTYWQVHFTPERGEEIRHLLRKAIASALLVFGDEAFIRPDTSGSRISKIQAELILVGFARLNTNEVRAHQDTLRASLARILESKPFQEVSDRSTSDAKRVSVRYELWQAGIAEGLGSVPPEHASPEVEKPAEIPPIASLLEPDTPSDRLSLEMQEQCRQTLRDLVRSGCIIYCHACQDPVQFDQINGLRFYLNQHLNTVFAHGSGCTPMILTVPEE